MWSKYSNVRMYATWITNKHTFTIMECVLNENETNWRNKPKIEMDLILKFQDLNKILILILCFFQKFTSNQFLFFIFTYLLFFCGLKTPTHNYSFVHIQIHKVQFKIVCRVVLCVYFFFNSRDTVVWFCYCCYAPIWIQTIKNVHILISICVGWKWNFKKH